MLHIKEQKHSINSQQDTEFFESYNCLLSAFGYRSKF